MNIPLLWKSLQRRSPSANGRFIYAVQTTGIYCRPTCPSRLPLLENVRFFRDSLEAEASGFRACKRCNPAA